MQIHELKPKNKPKSAKKVGRGGKRGKTSGRGHKGQKARAGSRIRPAARDMIKSIPKLRGATAYNRDRTTDPVNLKTIEANFSNGEVVSVQTLREKGILKGRLAPGGVKILGSGEITKKVSVEGCQISQTAKDKVKAAGGEVK